MYLRIFCLCVIATCALAAPPTDVVPLEEQRPTVIPIISQSEELEPNGTYKFSYETGNGIKREEISYDKVIPRARGAKGTDSNEGGEDDESDEIHVQQGSYSYTAPDGTLISVRYIADENGFQPVGDHIPRVPELGQSSTSPNEKSSRALKAPDNVSASSVPALTARAGDTSKPLQKAKSSAPPSGKPAATAADSEATTKSAESEVTTVAADTAATTAAVLVDNLGTTAAGPAESEATTNAAPVENAASPESSTTPSDATPPATPTGSPASSEAVVLNSSPSEGAATTTADEQLLTSKPELAATEPAGEQASTAATELVASTTGTEPKEDQGTQGVAAP